MALEDLNVVHDLINDAFIIIFCSFKGPVSIHIHFMKKNSVNIL